MGKTLIFGHKNPDTDSITSSIVMANLEKKLGNDVEACRLGNINKETEYVLSYLGMEAPKLIEDAEDGTEVILVDTSNPGESIPNLENVQIKKVVDHHRVALTTPYPLYFRTEPVGCTQTVMYKLYKENNVEIDKTIATLMVSAIISDTLLFKSPTCTDEDKKVATELAKIAEIDMDVYGMDMLKAGTDLSSFTIEEILKLDAKETNLKDKKSIIAQVNTASIDDVLTMKSELEAGMQKIIAENDLDLFMFVITDIIESNSKAIVLGNSANITEKAYNEKIVDNVIELKGVVSRKKQIVPIMTENA
ncbi:MAG: manganese-dependent inorganic pyrophosphatase [Clostridia bacterium]|nr:manganese-dependent inorganic pyrophosphatase [Clostridia bacterium]